MVRIKFRIVPSEHVTAFHLATSLLGNTNLKVARRHHRSLFSLSTWSFPWPCAVDAGAFPGLSQYTLCTALVFSFRFLLPRLRIHKPTLQLFAFSVLRTVSGGIQNIRLCSACTSNPNRRQSASPSPIIIVHHPTLPSIDVGKGLGRKSCYIRCCSGDLRSSYRASFDQAMLLGFMYSLVWTSTSNKDVSMPSTLMILPAPGSESAKMALPSLKQTTVSCQHDGNRKKSKVPAALCCDSPCVCVCSIKYNCTRPWADGLRGCLSGCWCGELDATRGFVDVPCPFCSVMCDGCEGTIPHILPQVLFKTYDHMHFVCVWRVVSPVASEVRDETKETRGFFLGLSITGMYACVCVVGSWTYLG